MEHKEDFHEKLSGKIDKYVHEIYDCTLKFHKDELFGATSQLRRASLSIALNHIEGYARQRNMVFKNFLEIAYGSLKESQYLVSFCAKRGYIAKSEEENILRDGDEIGKMLWGIKNA